MKKIICKWIGHRWVLKPKPDILSNKRVCKRCGRVEKRVEFFQKPQLVEKWIGIS
jgi:hypothetical protein